MNSFLKKGIPFLFTCILGLGQSNAMIFASEATRMDENESLFETSDELCVIMYRLYNPNSGEHFYTSVTNERLTLIRSGWIDEGISWFAPYHSNTPVYRLYNSNVGDHHYTLDEKEKNSLEKLGWSYEGIGWYSDTAKSVPLYRQYNPNALSGSHNYTVDKAENDQLIKLGWKAEGIAWYGVKTGKPVLGASSPEYASILNEVKKCIQNKGNGNFKDEFVGIIEHANSSASLKDLGYVIQDFSGDGIPELAIVDSYTQNILAFYTLVNNAPVNVFYGWARSRNFYAGGSTFITNGAAGAAYSSTGLFTLSQDGRKITYNEYYYTEPDSSDYRTLNTYSSIGPDTEGTYIGGSTVYNLNYERIFAKQQNLSFTLLSNWK